MRVRAVAAPSRDSTAVGSIELECTPHGLVMTYLGVGSYRPGYAPGAVTHGTRVVAPWPDVLDVRTHQGAVLVSVSPNLTPHHKLYLENFSRGDVDLQQLGHKRRLLRIATIALMLAVAISLGASIPVWFPHKGHATALVVGLLGALAVFVASLLAERLWLEPAPDAEGLERRFLAEVQYYRPLPVLPALGPAPKPVTLADLLQVLPRSTTAIVIVLTAGSLAAVLTSSWILGGGAAPRVAVQAVEPRAPEPPPPPRAPAVLPAAAPPSPNPAPDPSLGAGAAPSAESAAESAASTTGSACKCERQDSVLWRLPLPRLSTLMIEQKLRAHEDHQHVELELAVVNNGNVGLEKISLGVDFFEGKDQKPTKHRPLYYESRLAPGAAIKWHVESRGTSFVVTNPRAEVLDPEQLATADDFEPLLRANHRPVRLHGAMMLAYLGDPRAREGATVLMQALREEESPYLERVMAAVGPVIACDIRNRAQSNSSSVELCVFNRGAEPERDVSLRLRGLDTEFDFRKPVAPPPVVVAEKSFRLPEELPAGDGRWVSLEVPNESRGTPKVFEAFATASAE